MGNPGRERTAADDRFEILDNPPARSRLSNARIDVKNGQPINKRKIFWVATIIAVAAIYQISHPFLERQFNVDLPSLVDQNNSSTIDGPKREWKESDWQIPEVDDQQPLIGEASSGKLPTRQVAEAATQDSKTDQQSKEESYLKPTGKKNRLRSPAGLVYGEHRGEHRVDHVMRHVRDDPSRPVHSVFDGDRESILRMIDEAYRLIQSKSNRVKKTADKKLNFRAKYTVDMQRKIGYLGGKQGQRQNYPERRKLSLVLDNEKFMVTAYPDK